MKKCPFCAEEIQEEAVKCKHCGEFLDESFRPSSGLETPVIPWYFRTTLIVIAVGCIGPFALPLIWFRPQTSRNWKIGLTIIILALSWLMFAATMKSLETLEVYYEMMNG